MSDTPLYPTPIGDQAPRPLTAEEAAECLRIASHFENWYIGVRQVLLKVEDSQEVNIQDLRWVIDGAPALKVIADEAAAIATSYHGS